MIRSGDIEEVYPEQYTGQFNLVPMSYLSSTTTPPSSPNSSTSTSITIIIENQTSTIPVIGHLYHNEPPKKINIVSPKSAPQRKFYFRWILNQIRRFPLRSLFIGAIIAGCFLLFLVFIVIRLHYTNRSIERKNLADKHNQTNGKAYSQLHRQSKRYSIVPGETRESKKRVPNLLRHLHTDETKPTSFRLSSSGGDSYHLISSIQETNKTIPYRNSDCVLNEHCCIHSSLSQPISTSPSFYHQINRLMLSGSDPPLPLPTVAQSHQHSIATATLRTLKKDIDNTSSQTYSAVYSCEPVANLDIDQDVAQKRSSMKRRSILKNTHSSVNQTKILFLYDKNLVDCYALQPNNKTTKDPIVLATADENRIQLYHALVSLFHHYTIDLI